MKPAPASPNLARALATRGPVHVRPVAAPVHVRLVTRAGPGASLREHAAALVAHYQRELRLEEWRIAVEVKRDPRCASGRAVWGRIDAEPGSLTARLTLRDPATTSTPAAAATEGLRRAIVRAMVRLHFARFGDRNPKAAGAAIDAFAAALTSATTPVNPNRRSTR